MHCHVSRFKHTRLTTLRHLPILFSELLSHAVQNVCLHILLLPTDTGQIICWVHSFSNDACLRAQIWVASLTVDAIGRVIKHFIS